MANILTVEDSPSTRRIIADALISKGHSVIDAGNGKEGLEKAKGNKVDLVITDINMPIMDGFALIAELRKEASYRYIPIVALTTESTTEKKMMGRDAGATAWIVKPFTPEKLIEVVNRVLR